MYYFYESHGLWKWFEFNGFYWNHDLDFSQFSIEWIKFVFYLKGYLSKFSWSFSIHNLDNYVLKLYVNQECSSWFSLWIFKEENFLDGSWFWWLNIWYAWIEILLSYHSFCYSPKGRLILINHDMLYEFYCIHEVISHH